MSTIVNKDVDMTLQILLDDIGSPLFVIDPSSTVIEHLVEIVVGMNDPPKISLLAKEDELKEISRDFIIASKAAELVEADLLSIRSADTDPGNTLFLTETELAAVVSAGNMIGVLTTDDLDFAKHGYDVYSTAWESGDPFSLRTPSLSRVRETLKEEIGAAAETDFTAVLSSLDTARGNGNGLDEVTISLLVAAKNQELLYDISKWGEDVGLASKATFSRTKTTLEELGLIDTEKVPIDVGRPRLRLKFAHERLRNANADELASVAQNLLA